MCLSARACIHTYVHTYVHRIVVDLRMKQQLLKQIHRREQGSTLNFTRQSQLLAAGVTTKTLHSKILVPHGRPVCVSGHDPRVNVMGASSSWWQDCESLEVANPVVCACNNVPSIWITPRDNDTCTVRSSAVPKRAPQFDSFRGPAHFPN